MALHFALCLVFLAVVTAKLTLQGAHDPTRIEGNYIVVYHENTTREQFNAHLKGVSYSTSFKYTYDIGETFKGFAAELTPRVLDAILDDPMISEVHYDGLASIAENSCTHTQPNAPSWGIARTSHKGGFDNEGLRDDHYYDQQFTGQGVDIYILDTGIYITHNDFGGRARYGANFVDSVPTDQNSHGTHCAGTAAGARFGLAKAANLIAVKVLNAGGSGSYSGIIAGIQWVTTNYNAGTNPAVASMSLGGTADGGMNAAVRASILAGIVYSIAAGNSNGNACNFYPASEPLALTVGSTTIASSGNDEYDQRSSFSNFGTCLDIWAPGTSITSAAITGPDSSSVKSGTSMACPHVTGAVAVILGQQRDLTPPQVQARLNAVAQVGLVDNAGAGSVNLLLYNGCDEA